MKKNTEKKEIEKRHFKGELRTIEDQGIVTAYLTKWGTVDSYGTTFIKGSFKKTFQERGTKIRLIDNHNTLVGKTIDMGEDDYGPWVKSQFNLDTRAGFDSFAHVKAGDMDCYSFGFNRMQSRPNGDVVEITEVRVMEVGPVVFEANSDAKIMNIRAESLNETLEGRLHSRLGHDLFMSLEHTIEDIRWGESDSDEMVSKTDVAISDFHAAYIQWMTDVYANSTRSEDALKEIRENGDSGNAVKAEMRKHDIENLVKTTPITEDEINTLAKGGLLPISARSKLNELPDSIKQAHQLRRCEIVSTFCDELRGSGFSGLEKNRFTSLLNLSGNREANCGDDEKKLLLSTIESWNL